MRNVDDGEERKKKRKKKENTSLAAPGALAHRLQRRTACQWAPKWLMGSGKVSSPRFWGAPVNFRTRSMRKVDDGEEK